MISIHELANVMHGNVQSTDGEKVGRVGRVYVHTKTGEPEWVNVHTGLFGSQHSFVPRARATMSGSDIHVPFGKATVKDAPRAEADGELTPTEEDELYAYYGVQGGGEQGAETTNTGRDLISGLGVVGHDTSGPTTNHAMTIPFPATSPLVEGSL